MFVCRAAVAARQRNSGIDPMRQIHQAHHGGGGAGSHYLQYSQDNGLCLCMCVYVFNYSKLYESVGGCVWVGLWVIGWVDVCMLQKVRLKGRVVGGGKKGLVERQ